MRSLSSQISRLQAELGSGRQGRSLPAQRRTAELPAERPRRLPRIRHHEQFDRQSTQDRNSGPARCSIAVLFKGRSSPLLGAGSALFSCRFVRATTHGGALRSTANCAILRSPAALRSSNNSSPPKGSALRATAVPGRLRATPSHGHPPLQLIIRTPRTATTARRAPNAASPLRGLSMHLHSGQNGSPPSSDAMTLEASATFLPGNTPLSRNVRRPRSVISMPRDFNTSCI